HISPLHAFQRHPPSPHPNTLLYGPHITQPFPLLRHLPTSHSRTHAASPETTAFIAPSFHAPQTVRPLQTLPLQISCASVDVLGLKYVGC
ncbi:hypothetical protein BC829DRAFT_405614, partial [Chytridium lagenaria]